STFATATAALMALGMLAAFTRGRAHGFRIALAKLFHRGLAGELDAAGVVDEDHLHLDLVADLHVILDSLDILIRQLADMAQAVGLGRDLDERAEILDRDDHTVVDLADLYLRGHRFDNVARLLGGFPVHGADIDRAVILDVDIGAGVFLDLLDVLAARADD